ncbi:MAG: hypothetical protein IJU64_02140 [Bacilli bacterium]|nr:hypothetical protein [Bacilli bacterium]
MGVYYTLSVHQFVDFLLRAGDIDNRIYNQETMGMGTKLHAAFQAKQGRDYLSEVALSGTIEVESGTITLQGRADGIIVGGPYPILDEIKSTVQDVKVFASTQEEWHLGQALSYAYLYLKQNGGEQIGIRLTYLSQVNDDQWVRDFTFTKEEVFARVENLARDYIDYMAQDREHRLKRDASAAALTFPFGGFRQGQRELSRLTFGAIKKRQRLFAEAPTGIGKTMATLFPAVKSFEKDRVDRIFYFTAKTTGARAAFDAVGLLYDQGFVGYDSLLQAKEKICLKPGASCNPDECPFAKNYYGKLKGALRKAKETLSRFDPPSLSAFCRQEEICPFEFQLDLSLSSDIIVADYNYFFDPMVHLERYFDETVDSSTFVTLVDEAHNLIKRGRDMYSVVLSYEAVEAAIHALHGDGYRSLRTALGKIKKALLEPTENPDTISSGFLKSLESFKRAKQKQDKKEQEQGAPKQKPGEAYIALSREIGRFNRIYDEYYGSNPTRFKVHVFQDEHPAVSLFCLDPSPFLRETLEKVRASVLFSATMSPMEYYQDSLVGSQDDSTLLLSSPFPKENLKVLVAPRPTTRYKQRDRWYGEVARYLEAFVAGKKGNYFLYFPSYEYMEKMASILDFGDADVYPQERQMDDMEKSFFLSRFLPNPQKTTVGLLVLGGAFSEGIDLVDDRLIGVAVVGIGLPQVGVETEDLRAYYEQEMDQGFAYAYLYPGVNKVLQAVGRVIRSESDVGAALFIDSRFLGADWRPTLNRLYPDLEVVMDEREIADSLRRFYDGKNPVQTKAKSSHKGATKSASKKDN